MENQPYDSFGNQDDNPFWEDIIPFRGVPPTKEQIQIAVGTAQKMIMVDHVCIVCGCPDEIGGYRTHAGEYPRLIIQCGNHQPKQTCYMEDRR